MVERTPILAPRQLLRRPALRAATAALVLALLLAAAISPRIAAGPAPVAPAAVTRAASGGELARLPSAARGPVSTALGAAQAAYRVSGVAGAYVASNPAQHLTASFTRAGVSLRSGGLHLNLSLSSVGYGRALHAVAPVTPTASGNRADYDHGGVREWYGNGPLGIEQGFTVAAPPSPRRSGSLTLSMALSGDARSLSLTAGGRALSASRPGGPSLSYGALSVADAHGRLLHSWLSLSSGHLLLHVADRGAHYPLRIDPFVQVEELTGGPEELESLGEPLVPTARAALGFSVAMSADGNTALVGAPNDDGFNGAAWVFTRSSGLWSQQGPKLTAGEAEGEGSAAEQCSETTSEEEECAFGKSVALSADGNTALIGGPKEPGPCGTSEGICSGRGAAWVFIRSGSAWTLQSKLTGGAEQRGTSRFGHSVALSADGNTAAVGGPAGLAGHGAVWVFTRSGSAWSQQGPMLSGGEEAGESHIGASIALSGDGNTVLTGGPGDDSYAGAAWLFTRSEGSWTQQGTKLTGGGEEVGAGHFGFSVALSGDGQTALIGARKDASGQGSAWVFTLTGDSWAQQGPKLTGEGESGEEAQFGSGVALSADGDVALIGAPHASSDKGAAWLYIRSGGSWTSAQKLTSSAESATPPSKGAFGTSVALRSDGETALVGAPDEQRMAGGAWAFADPSVIPVVESLSPSSGPTAGGTAVHITGSRLAGATAVDFGATPASSFTVGADGSIAAVAPPSSTARAVCVQVITPEGASATEPCPTFTYVASSSAGGSKLPLPTVTAVSPTSGTTAGGRSWRSRERISPAPPR